MQRIAILAYPPPQAPEGIARWGAQAYRNLWQIERSFETVKQEFSLEKLRVRTFRRLRNVFSLCAVAYLFVTRSVSCPTARGRPEGRNDAGGAR